MSLSSLAKVPCVLSMITSRYRESKDPHIVPKAELP